MMSPPPPPPLNQPDANTLYRDAISIWRSGVEAVTPRSLIRQKIARDGQWLIIDDRCEIDLASTGQIILVGAGKASAAMAVEFFDHVCRDWPSSFPKVSGWINAPAGSFAGSLPNVHLHAARPEGANFPTQQAIEGTRQILQLVSSAKANDVVICLISGGGSALLVSPQPGLDLEDKQAVAKYVAAAGGNIVQLNLVRRCISQVKGGGLARACTAGRLVSLIISDVLGDPLEIIASGPTVISGQPDYAQALSVLKQLGLDQHPKLQRVATWLSKRGRSTSPQQSLPRLAPENIILGNLADAVDAAGVKAVELGYRYIMQTAREPEGDVAEVAKVAELNLRQLRSQSQIDCWISGGEPTVTLPDAGTGKGGRNQQLALSVLDLLMADVISIPSDRELAFLSGGTDGEDGPTNAAGAWIDDQSMAATKLYGLDPRDYLDRADAYHFFEKVGGLLITGATGTNVGDLRIGLCRKKS